MSFFHLVQCLPKKFIKLWLFSLSLWSSFSLCVKHGTFYPFVLSHHHHPPLYCCCYYGYIVTLFHLCDNMCVCVYVFEMWQFNFKVSSSHTYIYRVCRIIRIFIRKNDNFNRVMIILWKKFFHFLADERMKYFRQTHNNNHRCVYSNDLWFFGPIVLRNTGTTLFFQLKMSTHYFYFVCSCFDWFCNYSIWF